MNYKITNEGYILDNMHDEDNNVRYKELFEIANDLLTRNREQKKEIEALKVSVEILKMKKPVGRPRKDGDYD